ncbi:hypothetical protein CRYUN_Cryun34aG0061000 [Craigia yunnanensis]
MDAKTRAEMKRYSRRGLKNLEKKQNLENVFKSYASDGRLSQKQLKNAFDHLGSLMPYKDAEEAMKVADINNNNFVSCSSKEFNSLVEYAYNKGFGNSF